MSLKKNIIALVILNIIPFAAQADNEDHGKNHNEDQFEKYTIALFGDMPYNVLGKQQYPNLITDVNNAEIAFSVFDGDLKAGGDGPCTDENLYAPALQNFNKFKQPLIFVNGDNDWTDCWGLYGPSTTAAGANDPIERLQHERDLFYSTPYSLGQHKLKLTRQSSEDGQFAKYVENVRWQYGPVVYIGMNVQGSNDNFPHFGIDGETRSQDQIDIQRTEEVARKAANLHWLKEGFDYAKQVKAAGVMIIIQANLNFNNENQLSNPLSWDAYPDYINALRDAALAFPGQVAFVHGDSHYFKLDYPLSGPKGGVVSNFTRVETFGARNTHWVSATIDIKNPKLFDFSPRFVAENLD